MSDGPDTETLVKIVSGGALAFGVAALVAPDTMIRGYGMNTSPATRYMTRLWGAALGSLGALGLSGAPGPERRRMLIAGVVLNLVDAVAVCTSSDLSARTRLQVVVTSGSFGAAGAAALAGDD